MVGLVISPVVEATLTKCPKPYFRKTGSAGPIPYRTFAPKQVLKNGCLPLLTWSDELNRHSFIAGPT